MLLFFVIGLLILILICDICNVFKHYILVYIELTIVLSILIVGILCVVINAPIKYHTEHQIYESENIVALGYGTETAGSFHSGFFVGSGYINGYQYYYVMQNTSDGYSTKKLDANNTYIKEIGSSKQPKIEHSENVKYGEAANKTIYFLFDPKRLFNQYINGNGNKNYVTIEVVNDKWTIYVPKGTVVQNYNVDISKTS